MTIAWKKKDKIENLHTHEFFDLPQVVLPALREHSRPLPTHECLDNLP